MKSIEATIFQSMMKQTLYVFQDGKLITKKDVILDDLPKELFKLSNKYNINNIHFYGTPHYLEHFVQQIKEEEIKQYQKNKLNIEIRNKLDYI